MSSKKQEEKKLNDAAEQAANLEAERRKAIAEFNVQNMGKYWIDPDKTPTSDDIEAIKKEFEDRVKSLQEKQDYVIADKDNALRVAKFMKEFNDNSMWSKEMFKGVLNFSALMKDFIDSFDEKNPVELSLPYAPMQYAFILFDGFSGKGIEEANHMAEIWEEFVPIYDKLHELVDWYKSEVDACEKIKQRWAMFEQGYYMYIMDDDEEQEQSEDQGTVVPGDLTQE